VKRDVLAVGESMVLVTPDVAGPLETSTLFRLEAAGAESNLAVHLAREGLNVAWAGAVGDDPLGRRLLTAISHVGVDTSFAVVDGDAPTGVYFKDPGAGSTNVYYYRSGSAASRLGPAFAATLPLDSVAIVHISGITAALSDSCLALLNEIISVRRAAGLPVSFDVNYRARLWAKHAAAPVLQELASRCDIVLVGRDEAESLWDTSTDDDVRALFPDVERLVVKDGDVGASEYTAAGRIFVPAFPVEVVESVGAGDAFAAGYLSGLLEGGSSRELLTRGHRKAAVALITTADA
jgi:2-dehydro-3-deoxygluconokinase